MDMSWYNTLIQPAFTPESWVFTPAWLFLYGLILLSLLVYKNSDSENNKMVGYIFFSVQLILNFLWTPAFFVLHNIPLSFAIICLLLAFVIVTTIEFFRISKISSALLVPYFLWLCFAVYLNYGFLMLNPVC